MPEKFSNEQKVENAQEKKGTKHTTGYCEECARLGAKESIRGLEGKPRPMNIGEASEAIYQEAKKVLGYGKPGAERGEYGTSAMTPDQVYSWQKRIHDKVVELLS